MPPQLQPKGHPASPPSLCLRRVALPSLGLFSCPCASLSPLLKYFTSLNCSQFLQHVAFLTKKCPQRAHDHDSRHQRAPARPAGARHPASLAPRPTRFRLPAPADLSQVHSPTRSWLRYASPPMCRGCSPSSPASLRGCGQRVALASRPPRSPGRTRSRRRCWRARRKKRGCSWC